MVTVAGSKRKAITKADVDALGTNADTLDGQHASEFASAGHTHSFVTSNLSDVDNTNRSDGAVLVFSDASSKYEATTTVGNENTVLHGGTF